MMTEQKPNREHPHAASAAKKLEGFFSTLNPEEQTIISNMVRASLVQAAERFRSAGQNQSVPDYVTGLTGQNAPTLVKSLRLPGSLVAHSIPGCNAAALREIQKELGATAG
jgi:hypothetical protein